MKHATIRSILAALGILLAAPISAADFYGQVSAGAVWLQDDEGNAIDFAPGSSVSAVLGWQLEPRWSLELQTGHIRSSLNTFRDFSSADRDLGAVTMFPAVLNVTRSWSLGQSLELVLSAGAGGIRIEEGRVLSPRGVDHDRWDPLFQAGAQLRYALSSHCDLSLSWRYLATGLQKDELRAQALELGSRWRF
jgi:opacity protein-like surface antigen